MEFLSIFVDAWEQERGNGQLMFNGDRDSVQEGEKFRRWMMMRVAEQCECT